MQVAHEMAREKDRRELQRLKKDLDSEKVQELEKEIAKMKEIVSQEYEFKIKHLDQYYAKKHQDLVDQLTSEK